MGIHDDLQRGIHITPGDGIVAKLGDFLAFAAGDDAGLNQLIVRLNALAGADWSEIVRTLTADIVAAGYEQHPLLACAQVRHDRVGVLVFGSLRIEVSTDHDTRVLDGTDSNTWIDVAIHGAARRISCGEQSDSTVVGVLRDGVVPAGGYVFDPAGPIPAATRWDDFELELPFAENGGLSVPSDDSEDVTFFPTIPPIPELETPAGSNGSSTDVGEGDANTGIFGRLNELHSQPPEFDPSTETIDDSVDADSEDSAGSTGPSSEIDVPDAGADPTPPAVPESATGVPQPPPIVWPAEPPPMPVVAPAHTATVATPQVHGVLCPDGHLTSVRDRTCRTCGKRPNPSGELQIGSRPSLGTITFDDGAVLPIDRPAVIGRDVDPGYEISGEPATIALIGDDADTIAPVHAEIRLIGWDVELVAMSPETGTYTRMAGERHSRTKLRTGIPTVLTSGTVVEMGGRSFEFTVGPTAETDAA